MATIELVNATKFFGWTLFTVNLAVRQIGPAYVELRFQAKLPFRCMSSRPLVTGVFLQFVKPIGPMRNSIVHQVYTEGSVLGYIFGKFLILAEARMVRVLKGWTVLVCKQLFIFLVGTRHSHLESQGLPSPALRRQIGEGAGQVPAVVCAVLQ